MVSNPVQVELPIPLPDLLKDEPAFKAVVDAHQRRLKELGDWRIFPLTIEMIAQGRFSLDNQSNVYVDGMRVPRGFRLGPDTLSKQHPPVLNDWTGEC
jgi:hypothetical protein